MAYKLTLLRFVRYRARKNKGKKTHSNYRIRRHEALSQKHQKKNKKSPPPKKTDIQSGGLINCLLYSTVHAVSFVSAYLVYFPIDTLYIRVCFPIHLLCTRVPTIFSVFAYVFPAALSVISY
jgi:hypothetical protein